MIQNKYTALGLMSGTSLDGLDLALCHFYKKGEVWQFELVKGKSVDYDAQWTEKLKNSVNLNGRDLWLLHVEYGRFLGQQAGQFLKECNLQVDFIASHGHTVFHQPEKKLTLQIGSGHELATESKQTVICDFRALDLALGGQGAPLVPIGDRYLFSEYDFCLNLGGISNISFELEGKRMAYDVSIANMLLNNLVQKLGKSYDKGGEIARTGAMDEQLYSQLNDLSYLKLPYPKSTGFEWFEEKIQPIIERNKSVVEDQLFTAVHHIAFQVSQAVLNQKKVKGRLLITGGGAKNTFLMETLKHYLSGEVEMVIPTNTIIEFKEAIIFAFMGVKRLRNEVNCLSSVTGAQTDNCGGVIYLPN